jgi:hypothetical protein
MSCDYSVTNELVIEYINANGSIDKMYSDKQNIEYFIDKNDIDYDSDSENYATFDNKYKKLIEFKIAENTYNKIIYDNNVWIKPEYKHKFDRLLFMYNITKVIRIYKKYKAFANV